MIGFKSAPVEQGLEELDGGDSYRLKLQQELHGDRSFPGSSRSRGTSRGDRRGSRGYGPFRYGTMSKIFERVLTSSIRSHSTAVRGSYPELKERPVGQRYSHDEATAFLRGPPPPSASLNRGREASFFSTSTQRRGRSAGHTSLARGGSGRIAFSIGDHQAVLNPVIAGPAAGPAARDEQDNMDAFIKANWKNRDVPLSTVSNSTPSAQKKPASGKSAVRTASIQEVASFNIAANSTRSVQGQLASAKATVPSCVRQVIYELPGVIIGAEYEDSKNDLLGRGNLSIVSTTTAQNTDHIIELIKSTGEPLLKQILHTEFRFQIESNTILIYPSAFTDPVSGIKIQPSPAEVQPVCFMLRLQVHAFAKRFGEIIVELEPSLGLPALGELISYSDIDEKEAPKPRSELLDELWSLSRGYEKSLKSEETVRGLNAVLNTKQSDNATSEDCAHIKGELISPTANVGGGDGNSPKDKPEGEAKAQLPHQPRLPNRPLISNVTGGLGLSRFSRDLKDEKSKKVLDESEIGDQAQYQPKLQNPNRSLVSNTNGGLGMSRFSRNPVKKSEDDQEGQEVGVQAPHQPRIANPNHPLISNTNGGMAKSRFSNEPMSGVKEEGNNEIVSYTSVSQIDNSAYDNLNYASIESLGAITNLPHAQDDLYADDSRLINVERQHINNLAVPADIDAALDVDSQTALAAFQVKYFIGNTIPAPTQEEKQALIRYNIAELKSLRAHATPVEKSLIHRDWLIETADVSKHMQKGLAGSKYSTASRRNGHSVQNIESSGVVAPSEGKIWGRSGKRRRDSTGTIRQPMLRADAPEYSVNRDPSAESSWDFATPPHDFGLPERTLRLINRQKSDSISSASLIDLDASVPPEGTTSQPIVDHLLDFVTGDEGTTLEEAIAQGFIASRYGNTDLPSQDSSAVPNQSTGRESFRSSLDQSTSQARSGSQTQLSDVHNLTQRLADLNIMTPESNFAQPLRGMVPHPGQPPFAPQYAATTHLQDNILGNTAAMQATAAHVTPVLVHVFNTATGRYDLPAYGILPMAIRYEVVEAEQTNFRGLQSTRVQAVASPQLIPAGHFAAPPNQFGPAIPQVSTRYRQPLAEGQQPNNVVRATRESQPRVTFDDENVALSTRENNPHTPNKCTKSPHREPDMDN
jgi:hypothetical protein